MVLEAPRVVADNLVVSMDYVLTVDGQVIDSTEGGAPIEFIQGKRNIIAGLERELTGMTLGETRDVVVAARDAYGEFDPQAFADIDRAQFPPSYPLEIGGSLRVRADNGRVLNAVIDEIGPDSVRLNLNHPLAGKELNFKATIVSLRPASEEEMEHGQVGGCPSCGSGGCGSDGCGSDGCGSGGCGGGSCC